MTTGGYWWIQGTLWLLCPFRLARPAWGRGIRTPDLLRPKQARRCPARVAEFRPVPLSWAFAEGRGRRRTRRYAVDGYIADASRAVTEWERCASARNFLKSVAPGAGPCCPTSEMTTTTSSKQRSTPTWTPTRSSVATAPTTDGSGLSGDRHRRIPRHPRPGRGLARWASRRRGLALPAAGGSCSASMPRPGSDLPAARVCCEADSKRPNTNPGAQTVKPVLTSPQY